MGTIRFNNQIRIERKSWWGKVLTVEYRPPENVTHAFIVPGLGRAEMAARGAVRRQR